MLVGRQSPRAGMSKHFVLLASAFTLALVALLHVTRGGLQAHGMSDADLAAQLAAAEAKLAAAEAQVAKLQELRRDEQTRRQGEAKQLTDKPPPCPYDVAKLRSWANSKGQIIVGVADSNFLREGGIAEKFIERLERYRSFYVVFALDDDALQYGESRQFHVLRISDADKVHFVSFEDATLPSSSVPPPGDPHRARTSAQKYKLFSRLLEQGLSIFATDMDVAITGNPFDWIITDRDAAVVSDGAAEGHKPSPLSLSSP